MVHSTEKGAQPAVHPGPGGGQAVRAHPRETSLSILQSWARDNFLASR